jgi:hypothetical protein
MPGRPAPRALVLLFVPLFLSSFAMNAGAQSAPAPLAPIPLVFEPNQGQAQSEYRFLARRGSAQALFREDGVDILISQSQSVRSRLRMRWLGAAPAVRLSAGDAFPGHSSYFRGSDPSHWVLGVPNFARLRYGQLYPGIDLVFHGREGMLEHDFEVHRGADPGRIRLSFDGPVRLDRSGNLMVDVGQAKIALLRPAAYQEMSGGRREVPARFVLDQHGVVKFRVGPYDKTRDLIIDPVFVFSTYLDGTGNDSITSVTTDAAGNVFVGGYTSSTDFPITNGGNPLCSTCSLSSTTTESFISKLDPTGHTLLFSAFLGGSNGAFIYSVGVDHNGNMYVGGTTGSFDFPHTGSVPPLTPTLFNHSYFFVASIKPDGSALNYSGLVGGTAGVFNTPGKMIVDPSGNAYLTGTTDDPNFQLTPGTLSTTPAGYPYDTMFVLKLGPTGNLVYSTLVPGIATRPVGSVNADDFVPGGLVMDANGQITIAGTGGIGLPITPGALLPSIPNAQNLIDPTAGFVLQLNSNATALNFATYLPGADSASGLAVNANGDLYIAGPTNETNLPVSAHAYQKALVPGQNCVCGSSYVMELNSQAKTILAATYLSGTPSFGNAGTYLMGIALDSKSNALVGGVTGSTDFPLKNPFVTTLQFSTTADSTVVAELSSDLSSLLFGSYLSSSTAVFGGSNFSALTVDSKDHTIVVGTTLASDFPTTSNAYQPTPPPPANPFVTFPHAFISGLDLSTPAPSVCLSPSSVNFGSILINTSASVNLNITNCGNAPLQISSVSSSVPSITAAPGCTTVAVGNTCTLQLTFSPTTSSAFFGTLTLTDNAAIATQTVSLSGAVGTPLVQIPSSFQVDDLLVGTQSESGIGFINLGSGNWIVSNVTATGDFSAVNHCTQPLAPFNPMSLPPPVCSIGIVFSPTAAGLRTGTLTITDNQVGSPHVVQLLGNALTIYATPSISQILAVPTDAMPATLQITGNNFFPASQVLVNGSPRATTYLGETFLFANLSTSDLAQPGELSVTVSTPTPGGGLSNTSIATVYAAIRNLSLLHTVYRPQNGHLYASVAAQSTSYAGQVIEIDPATAKVAKAWTVGNSPNQLAISDDGQFLYVGLDVDKKVAQVALPAGTVNFAVGLGNDPLSPTPPTPMVADALRVLPGQPHAWAVTLCSTGEPCGRGIAVFDDAVQRPTYVSQNQLQPDVLLFVGQDASSLFGTTLSIIPSAFYKFAINSTGISLSQTAQNFAGPSPGGGALNTDGTLIYVNNGQVIDPATLAIQSGGFQVPGFNPAFAVDPPASHVYFAGLAPFDPTSLLFYQSVIQAFSLTSQQPTGQIPMDEGIGGDMFRWGTNGLAIAGGTGMLLVRTSLTNQSAPSPQFSVSSLAPINVVAGIPDLALTIAGSGFASGDTVTANGTSLQIGALTPTQITTTVPAGLISVPGDVQIAVSDTNNHVLYLVLVVGPGPTAGVAISTNYLMFSTQIVGTSSSAQTVTILNNGTVPLVISGIALTGDFSEANTCGTVAPGGNCTASVTFQPTATGSRSGALTISDNDPSKSQTIALSGTGADIQIAPASGSSSMATVTAGQPATYALSIALEGGSMGRFSFACSNLPKFAACTFNPANAVLGTSPVSVSVTISTSQSHSATENWFGFGPLARTAYLLAVILGLMACITVARLDKRRQALATWLLFLSLAVLPLAGCTTSSSSASGSPPPAVSTTPVGSYTVNFTVTNSQISRSIPLTLVVK